MSLHLRTDHYDTERTLTPLYDTIPLDQSATTRPSLLHTWYVWFPQHNSNRHPPIPPKQHAHSAELLLPYLRDHPGGRGARVLDVGAGSGYLTSVLYHLASERASGEPPAAQQQQDSTVTVPGTDANANAGAGAAAAVVVGIEHIPELTALAERNIRADGLGGAIDEQAIVLVTGDGRLGTFVSPLPLSLSLNRVTVAG